MAERLKALASKASRRRKLPRGFESHSLRTNLIACFTYGEVPERSNGLAWRASRRGNLSRGFKSHPLRNAFLAEYWPRMRTRNVVTPDCTTRTLKLHIQRKPRFGRAGRGGSGALHPQSAIAGSRPSRGLLLWGPPAASGDEGRVPRNGNAKSPPGPEGSNGNRALPCAAGSPGQS